MMKLWRSKTDSLEPLGTEAGAEKCWKCRRPPLPHTWIRHLIFAKMPAFFPLPLPRQRPHGLLGVRISQRLSSPKKKPIISKTIGKRKAYSYDVLFISRIHFFLGSSSNEIYPIWSFFSLSTRNILWKWKLSLSCGPCNSKAKFWGGFRYNRERKQKVWVLRLWWKAKETQILLSGEGWEVFNFIQGYHIWCTFSGEGQLK